MDKEKIKNLLEVGEKSAEDLRADAAAALIEIDAGIDEIAALKNDVQAKDDEIKKLKETNIRLYNMVTVTKPPTPEPKQKTFDEKVDDIISRYMK